MEASRTRHASDALHLSDLINLKYAASRYGTELPRYIRVTEPDGPSTDGGRKARQAILLCSHDDERKNVICGFIDSVKRVCELRSHQVISEAYHRRHDQPLELSAGEHRRFVEDLRGFVEAQGIEMRIEHGVVRPRPTSHAAAPVPTVVRRPRRSVSPVVAIAAAYLLGFVTCLALVHLNLLG